MNVATVAANAARENALARPAGARPRGELSTYLARSWPAGAELTLDPAEIVVSLPNPLIPSPPKGRVRACHIYFTGTGAKTLRPAPDQCRSIPRMGVPSPRMGGSIAADAASLRPSGGAELPCPHATRADGAHLHTYEDALRLPQRPRTAQVGDHRGRGGGPGGDRAAVAEPAEALLSASAEVLLERQSASSLIDATTDPFASDPFRFLQNQARSRAIPSWPAESSTPSPTPTARRASSSRRRASPHATTPTCSTSR